MGLCKFDFELTKLLCYLAKIYGLKLTMHTGWKHNYLGVDLEACEDQNLEVSVVRYLKWVEVPTSHCRVKHSEGYNQN